MGRMDITAPGKLVALCLIIIGCFVYIVVSLVQAKGADTTAAWATITLVSGYLLGNGTGARKGLQTVPPFSPKEEEVADK